MRLWTDLQPDSERGLRPTWVISALAHAALFALLVWFSPEPPQYVLPQAISVSLLPAPAASPAPAPKAAPKPATPKAAPAPKPPPKAKVKVLPKKAPTPVAKAQAKPKPKPKPKPKAPPKPQAQPEPTPKPVAKKKPRPEELSYDDALAKLRGELGEAPPAVVAPVAAPSRAAGSVTGRGPVISPELAAWNRAVKQHVKTHWIMPPEFRESGLAAELAIFVRSDGALRGEPELLRTSGNPYYDDNAIRALSRSSPLPPPPAPGRRVLVLRAEE